jgi:UDP-N-acetylmuramoyl-tripeptide--D-alanyl-D-alanine ligase
MKDVIKKVLTGLLLLEAQAVVRRYKPRIVAITGSVGKTSTKDAVYEVVAKGTHARKSQKSFNSEIGLPLTIIGRPNAWNNPMAWIQNLIDGLFLIIFKASYPDWLVLEVGADRPGDIQSVAKWLPVEIAVITRLPEVPVHVEFFSSADEVVAEKAALIDALTPDGTLVLYADDERANHMRLRAVGKHIITFGFSDEVDVRATDFEIVYEEGIDRAPVGIRARIQAGGLSLPVTVLGSRGLAAICAAARAHAFSTRR